MIRWTAIPFMLLVLSWHTSTAAEPILLDPKAPREVAVQLPLYGFRSFPEELFTFQKGGQYGIPTELIYASAAKIPELKRQGGEDIFDMEAAKVIEMLRDASRKSGWEDEETGWSEITTSVPSIGVAQVDAEFVTRLVSSELIDEDFAIFDGDIVGQEVEMVSVDGDVGRKFWSAYANLRWLNTYDPFERIDSFNKIGLTLAQYPVLLQTAKINFSPVSFGETFSYSAKEKELEIPASILRKYDVYWVEFAVSLRDLDKNNVNEISFHVFIPEDSIALELIPRRFGYEMSISEEMKTPEITMGEVSVGEFYRRTVAYTALKPTIVATGLRENQFSWVLSDEAVATGAYLFVGILGVPAGWDCINTGFGVNAKTADWLGIQGDIAGTGIIFKQICLG